MNSVYKLLLIVIWISIVLAGSILIKKIFPEKKELVRKLIHIGIGPLIPIAWWLDLPAYVAIPIALTITFSFVLNYKIRYLSFLEDIERNSFGTIAYGLSISWLFIFFWSDQPQAVSAGILVMAFADGFAGLFGRYIKSPQWKIMGQNKSIAGTFTMGFISALIILTMIIITGSNLYPFRILLITILITMIEQFSRWGLDNITVPLTIAYTWSWIID